MSVAAPALDVLTGCRASRYVIVVAFAAPDDQRWSAIGRGDTLADAIRFARDSCPAGPAWELAGWEDLYGD